MSIPREVSLRKTAEGIRLAQKPAREMASLRDQHFAFKGGAMAEANGWLEEQHIQGDRLELLVEFEEQRSGTEGVQVLKGDEEATVIGVDRQRRQAFVDRTRSGSVKFHPKFSGVYEAPLAVPDGKVKLHVFVDASSVEVFVNDGERVFTDLVYPSAASRARGILWIGERRDDHLTRRVDVEIGLEIMAMYGPLKTEPVPQRVRVVDQEHVLAGDVRVAFYLGQDRRRSPTRRLARRSAHETACR